ncbi:PREDICTED: uncharacterized protein LOC108661553 [Theobroma cacao]|uniref:Uncharacterized protein LOC108661553 n=1 Tax=Theobroma cacao TaxID=3641 RepID=A0AB32W907_THECC|nr:PREDICTED: uncharacterized protein LOC108661553 [Theobroma cacao]
MASASYKASAPLVFNGENYPIWVVKMKAYLHAFDLWDVIEVGEKLPILSQANPTIAQLKQHSEDVAKRFKVLSCIHSTISDSIFTRIMACESPKEAWDKLKEDFQGSDRMWQIQILNLLKEFDILKMREDESIKKYSDKILKLVNQLRLTREDLLEKRIVNKVFVSLLEKFEAKISSLEYFKDLSKTTITELVNALQA